LTLETGRRQLAVSAAEDELFPAGLATLTIPYASIVYQGPWTLIS
jgi:hypothetical protein